MEICEIAAAPSRDQDFLAQLVGTFENGNAATALAGLDGAHQAGSTTAQD